MKLGNRPFGKRYDLDTSKTQALVNTRDVFLVAGYPVERFSYDNLECAGESIA